jgi:hypothetical protein
MSCRHLEGPALSHVLACTEVAAPSEKRMGGAKTVCGWLRDSNCMSLKSCISFPKITVAFRGRAAHAHPNRLPELPPRRCHRRCAPARAHLLAVRTRSAHQEGQASEVPRRVGRGCGARRSLPTAGPRRRWSALRLVTPHKLPKTIRGTEALNCIDEAAIPPNPLSASTYASPQTQA